MDSIERDSPNLVEQSSLQVFANDTIHWKIDRGRCRVLRRQNDFAVSISIRIEKFEIITHPADCRPFTYTDWRWHIKVEKKEAKK